MTNPRLLEIMDGSSPSYDKDGKACWLFYTQEVGLLRFYKGDLEYIDADTFITFVRGSSIP